MRSGAFSMAEPRSSTKGVRTGAGRARRCRIQALSTAGCAADGSAVAASSRAASAQAGVPGLRFRVGGCRRPRPASMFVRQALLLASAVFKVTPGVVEIEPVERCIAEMMFKPGSVTLDKRGQRRRALAPRDRDAVAEVFEH